MPLETVDDLSLAYTPGVAGPSLAIASNPIEAFALTSSKSTVAIVSDGSAVLGLGNIGPEAALPVMEGKAALFKRFAGVDAFPIVLATQNVDEIVQAVKMIAPTFGGINLEDISAPRCFEVEARLKEALSIPVFHDDQHGTAVVVVAGLINALEVVGKKKENISVVIMGAGAAGTAIAKLLALYGVGDIVMCDSRGVISSDRNDLDESKKDLLTFTNKKGKHGDVRNALLGADVFIGVSKGNLLNKEDVATMNKDAIVFAMANPTPEIMPDEAKAGGVRVVGTGRSDFPNQLNNVLVFPGIFKGAIEARTKDITDEMQLAAAYALANLVEQPTEDKIIPNPFEAGVADAVAKAVKDCANAPRA